MERQDYNKFHQERNTTLGADQLDVNFDGAYFKSSFMGLWNTNAAALVAESPAGDSLIVSFRGTDPSDLLISDQFDWLVLPNHYDKFDPLIDAVDAYIQQQADIGRLEHVYIVGHSLGGAMVDAYMNAHRDGYLNVTFDALTLATPGYTDFITLEDSRILNFWNQDDPLLIPATYITLKDPGDDTTIFFGDTSDSLGWEFDQHHKELYQDILSFISDEATPSAIEDLLRTHDDIVLPWIATAASGSFSLGNEQGYYYRGTGADVLQGGHRDDILFGGGSSDTYQFGSLLSGIGVTDIGNDVIIDGGGSNDIIELNDAGLQRVTAVRQINGDVILTIIGAFGRYATITIQNYSDVDNKIETIKWNSNFSVGFMSIDDLLAGHVIANPTLLEVIGDGLATFQAAVSNNTAVVVDLVEGKVEQIAKKIGSWLVEAYVTQDEDSILGNVQDISGFRDVIGSDGDDRIIGDNYGNILTGGVGDDLVQAGSGDDFIIDGSGEGNDTYEGGDGIDTLVYSSARQGIVVNLSAASDQATGPEIGVDQIGYVENVIGSNYADKLTGDANANYLYGYAGNDWLYAGDGDDQVDAGVGDDEIVGGDGAGNDTYTGGDGIDTVIYTSAVQTITVNLAAGTASGVDIGSDVLISIENIVGGQTGDTLIGNDQANEIDGYTGNDTLIGGLGDDILDGGDGTDTAVFGALLRASVVSGNPASSAIVSGLDGIDSLAGIEVLRFVDGSLNFGAGTHIGQISRLYEAALGRGADTLGLNYHSGRLDGGTPLQAIAQDFVGSAEFQATYGSLNDSQFIQQLYLNVLGRPADPGGLTYWTEALASMTRGQVVTGFSESPENIANHAAQLNAGIWDINETAAGVARLYWGALGRAPDSGGLTNWTATLESGQTSLNQAAAGFIGSAEFQATYGSLDSTAFVNLLYQNVLGREADPGGLDNWVFQLVGGASRASVTLGFTESAEFQNRVLPLIDHGVVIGTQMTGTAGDDSLDGRNLIHDLAGGAGNDTYVIYAGSDAITENGGAGTDLVLAAASYSLPANVENLTLTGSATSGTGNALGNQLTGNTGNNTLTGGLGDDNLVGGSGADLGVFGGSLRQYGISGDPAGTAVVAGPDGTDSVAGIEMLRFVDGTLEFGRVAQVERLYEAALGRYADSVGLYFHSGRMEGGTSLDAVAQDFVGSAEFQATYGSLNDSQFIQQLYLNVLGRPADPGGLANWTGALASMTRGQVVTGFSESPENIANHAGPGGIGLWELDETAASVARLYWGALGRSPDGGGLAGWTNAVESGQISLTQAAAGFVGSAEFQATYGSLDNSAFVNLLYQNVLERGADPGGLASWVSQLDGGASRASVTLGFTESAEFQNRTDPLIDQGVVMGTQFRGATGDDRLDGCNLIHSLAGALGNDTLTGGAVADQFVFDTVLNPGTNVDTITNFMSGTDQILLDHAIFTALTAGTLGTGNFVAGPGATAAADPNDYLIYNSSTGALYYDPDGNGSPQSPTQFATLGISAHPDLTYGDFVVS